MPRRESITYADPTPAGIVPTMTGMETHTNNAPAAIDFLSPTAGWEAAARWNRATFDWVAKGWQQWLALMTTMPPQLMAPDAPVASARSVATEPARAVARASTSTSKASQSRVRGDDAAPARKRKSKATAKAGKATKTRARG